jgi:putative membrane protein insertion efficiency factor
MSARSRILDLAFTGYKRLLSPILHSVGISNCIFLPTSSEYARIALERHGMIHGGALAVRRIARCHPLSKGGLDPVP